MWRNLDMSALIFGAVNENRPFHATLVSISEMKIRDARGNNKKRDAFYAIAPLNYCLRLWALNCMKLDGRKLKQSWSISKNIFLVLIFGIISAFSFYKRVIIFSDGIIAYNFTNALNIIFLFGYIQYIIDLIYVYKYGRDICLDYYNTYNHIDRVLGITSYGESRRGITYLIIIFTVITAITVGLDGGVWSVILGPIMVILYGIDYMFIVLRNLTIADAIAQVIQVECRLEVMGDVLGEFYLSSENLPFVLKDIITDEASLKRSRIDKIQIIDQHQFKITKLCGCYLLILEQCDYINKTYGVRILGICLSNLIDMITSLNIILRIGYMAAPLFLKALFIFTSMTRLLSCAVVLLYEMHKCESCYKQTTRIIRYIDYLLVNKKITQDTRATLQNLRGLATSRPVQFHAVNFFKLDYALLLSITSVVVTYTIIILQNMSL